MQNQATEVVSETAFESKATVIARAIRGSILSGEFAEGSSLKQRDLARRFGVSATPVREALSRLEVEGYVANRLHQGAVVRGIHDRVEENWRLRAHLEPLATQLAVPRLSTQALDEVRRGADAFAHAGPDSAPRANREFHMALYRHSGSPVLIRFISELWQTIDLEPTTLRQPEVSAREHAEIVEAVAAGDAERAADLVRRHIEGTAPRQS